jgi:chromosome partitioning protein
MGKVISLLNMKGGVGKTTLSVNLSWYFSGAYKGKKVLLIDFDPQFNATQYVMDYAKFEQHRKTGGTIADLLIDQARLDSRLRKIRKNPKNAVHRVCSFANDGYLDLLPSELDLAWVVKNPAQMEYKLEKLAVLFRSSYDLIFVDCAPTDSVLTTMALTASDYILVPMRPDMFSILGFENLRKIIEQFKENCPNPNNVQDLGIVFTQVRKDSAVENGCMASIASAATKGGGYVFASHVPYSASFGRSIKERTLIHFTNFARSDTKRKLQDVAAELITRMNSLGVTK